MKRIVIPLLLALAQPAMSEDVALVITNTDVTSRADQGQLSQDHNDLVAAYDAKGYRIYSGENADRRQVISLILDVAEELAEQNSGRVVLHYSGAVATVGDQIFLIPEGLAATNTMDIVFDAVPLAALTELAERRGEDGTVVLAVANTTEPVLIDNPSVLGGFVPDDSVLAIHGPFRLVNSVVREELLDQARDVSNVAEKNRNVAFVGSVTARKTLADPSEEETLAEDTMWNLARESRSELMIRAYLERFPYGRYVDEAKVLLESEPGKLEEQSLRLNRAERREIQRKLTILGYDTRGIDGIFGRGTRGSVRDWQREAGFDQSGYFTAPQLRQLDRDVADREAEIREQERLTRIEDDDFWQQTGARGDEDDLRRYLDRYPNGAHADEAQDELDRIERQKQNQAQQADRDAWNEAKDINTVGAFEDYLNTFPRGEFVDNARQRIENKRARDTSKLAAEENALGMNSASRAVLELRLASLGYNVGNADGKITNQTRQAIAAFQKRSNLPSTGYLTKATVQKLLLSVF